MTLEADMGKLICDDAWDEKWSSSSGCLSTKRVKEMQVKMIHRLQITPEISLTPHFPKLVRAKSLRCHTSTVFLIFQFQSFSGVRFVRKFLRHKHEPY